MIIVISLFILYILMSVCAFYILIQNEKIFRRSIHSKITNGDIVFTGVISLIPGINLPVALLINFTTSYGPNIEHWASKSSKFFNNGE